MKEVRIFSKRCPKCGEELWLKESFIPNFDKDKEIIICPFCNQTFERMSRGTVEVINEKANFKLGA